MYRPIQVVLWSGVILCCMRTGAAHDVQTELSQFVNDTVNQVVEGLLPTLKELQGTVNSVRNDINRFNKTVNNLTEKVSNLEEHHDQLSSKMDQLESKLNSIKFKAVESQLEEHMNQTTSELVGLQRNTTSEIATLHTSLLSNTQQLTTKLDTLDSKVDSVNRAMKSQLEEHKNQATSELAGLQNMFNVSLVSHTEQLSHLNGKMDILDGSMREDLSNIKEDLSSLNEKMNRINAHVMEHDNYVTTELMNLDQNLEQKFTLLKNSLDYTYPIHTCGGTGGWRRVVYLDMTDPNTNCPSGWQLTSHSRRTCGKVSTSSLTCDSVTFSVSGGDYTRVCGRIKGYQSRGTDAFEAYDNGDVTTINGAYVSGVSLTHGSQRQHVWTFAAGFSQHCRNRNDVCPCDATIDITIPPFVGGDYFCESGRQQGEPFGNFFPNNPLWDGNGCSTSSTCCSFNNPLYFTKQLPGPTTDDIEARICQKDDRDDTPIELIELYVK